MFDKAKWHHIYSRMTKAWLQTEAMKLREEHHAMKTALLGYAAVANDGYEMEAAEGLLQDIEQMSFLDHTEE